MHQIAALIAGIRGADNGTASIYRRGTSTPVTCYVDFEGTSTFNGGSVPLDAYGSAIVFVNEVVRVVARNASGATVREWVAGDAATAVELRSLSATGAAYSGGALAPGNPTTVKAWADSWLTSAGAPDFEVMLNGVATDLETALSGVAGLRYYVVTDDAYGAAGDGVTNDLGAIQAAINAANAAGGGIVFFPPGEYLVNGTLTSYGSVEFRGYSADYATIRIQSASAQLMTGDAPKGIRELSLTFVNTPYTTNVFEFSGPAGFSSTLVERVVVLLTNAIRGGFFVYTAAGPNELEATFRGCAVRLEGNATASVGSAMRVAWDGGLIEVDGVGIALNSALIFALSAEIDGLQVEISDGASGTKNIVSSPYIVSSGLTLTVSNAAAVTTIVFFTDSAVGSLRERGTVCSSSSLGELVNLYSGFQASAFMTEASGTIGGICLGSRQHAYRRVSGNSDPFVVEADQARYVTARVTNTGGWAGNGNVDVNLAPEGSDVIISFWNDTGAPITFVWGANVSVAAATTFVVAANSYRTFHLVVGSNNPTATTLEWFIVSSTAGAEVVE